MLPLLALVGLTAFCCVAAFGAAEHAGQAAEAGAVALLQDGDAKAAARRALPAATRDDAKIQVDGGRVTVEVRPRLPLAALEPLLTATERAEAGRP